MDLQNILLTKVKQTQKSKNNMPSHIYQSQFWNFSFICIIWYSCIIQKGRNKPLKEKWKKNIKREEKIEHR